MSTSFEEKSFKELLHALSTPTLVESVRVQANGLVNKGYPVLAAFIRELCDRLEKR